MVFKKRPIKRFLKKKRVYKSKKPTVSLAVKKYVKRAIHVEVENKGIQTYVGSDFGTIAENTTLHMFPVLPYTSFITLAQGVGAGQRVGNKITLRKVMLNYILRPNPYQVSTNTFPQPMEITMFLGNVKQYPGVKPEIGDVNILFQLNNSAIPPSGTLTDVITAVNTDDWNIQKRWNHKIGFADYSGTGINLAQQSYSNNDYKLNVVRKMNITSMCPKTLIFNDSNTTTQTKNLFFFYQAVAAAGGTFSATQLPCHIDYWITMDYEDA